MEFTDLTNNVAQALDKVGLYAIDQNIFISNKGKSYRTFSEIVQDIKDRNCVGYLDVVCLISPSAWRQVELPYSNELNNILCVNWDEFDDWLRESLYPELIDLEIDEKDLKETTSKEEADSDIGRPAPRQSL